MLKFIIITLFVTISYAKTYKYTNDLISEDSPYLQQHAHNPVDWHAWNKQTFQKAKKEGKLIFLSIGYSTCHWCHVMEEESFEDMEVAKILNDDYIAIKVDREEMPSVDKHFQEIYHIMHKKGGGWPLNLILTPDAKPFYSATYIPKQTRYGRVGLIKLLEYFAEYKKHDITQLKAQVQKIQDIDKVIQNISMDGYKNLTVEDISKKFVDTLYVNYDKDNKGIGILPKFPHASTIDALLDIYKLNKSRLALEMADGMLKAMAKGGIYDQIEGGFFRYSTDEEWMIPHYEKMLYTNAELLGVYAKAYDVTSKKLYEDIVKELVLFVDKRFYIDGVYMSASDADSLNVNSSKKEEGYYFVFDYKEAKKSLKDGGVKNYEDILNYLGITEDGNFDDKSNPHIDDDYKKPYNLTKAKDILVKLRSKKTYPFVDNKILTSWNALYIKALFVASSIDKSYIKKAKHSLDTLLDILYVDGELYHQKLLGKKVKVKGVLEDYAFLSSALLEAYKTTFDVRYLKLSKKISNEAIDKFYKDGVWYESLEPFKVKATFTSSAYVNGLATMLDNLLIQAVMDDKIRYQDIVKNTFNLYGDYLSRYPSAYPKASMDMIAYKKGYIVLKSTKKSIFKLKTFVKSSIDYPFISYKIQNEDIFLGCKLNSCFVYNKDINKFVSSLKVLDK